MSFTGAGQAMALTVSSFVLILQEQGGNVVGTGSGTIDTAALSGSGSGSQAFMIPSSADLVVGSTTSVSGTSFSGLTGPTNFGTGGFIDASSGSGENVGISGNNEALFVPTGYVSGNSISGTATWAGATFASLGITPGAYQWTWGTGPDAGTFILNIGAVVPEPSRYGLCVFLAIAGLTGWRRFSRSVA